MQRRALDLFFIEIIFWRSSRKISSLGDFLWEVDLLIGFYGEDTISSMKNKTFARSPVKEETFLEFFLAEKMTFRTSGGKTMFSIEKHSFWEKISFEEVFSKNFDSRDTFQVLWRVRPFQGLLWKRKPFVVFWGEKMKFRTSGGKNMFSVEKQFFRKFSLEKNPISYLQLFLISSMYRKF